MAKTTNLVECFNFVGTFLFQQKADAESTATILGLHGAFPIQTDEGVFWMPGQSYDTLMECVNVDWIVSDKATVLQAPPQKSKLTFLAYLNQSGEK